MNIGVDIDDTLTNLHKLKEKWLFNYVLKNNMKYNYINKNTNKFSEMLDWPEEEYIKFWFENADKMLTVAKPRKNSVKVLSKLREEGHKIIIVTARTKQWHKDPYKLSVDWLNKNGIEYDELFVGYEDKSQISFDKKIDLFIDDMPENLEKISARGIKTAIMLGKHNKDYKNDNMLRFKNWKEAYKYIHSSLNNEK